MNPHLNGVHMNGLNMNRIKTERCDDGKISVHVDVQQDLQNGTFIQINETKGNKFLIRVVSHWKKLFLLQGSLGACSL